MMMKELSKDMDPVQMLVIYQAPKDTDVYIEQCKLNKGTDGYTPGPMQPLTMDNINKLANALSKKRQKSNIGGYIPDYVHYFELKNGQPTILWAHPPRKHKMFFSKATKMGTEAEVIMPGMIYYLDRDDLHIWCVKNDVVRSTTKLYRLPLPNTYADGSICWGNTNKPANRDGSIIGEITAWEGRFWNSEFTFDGGEAIQKEWSAIIKAKRYPVAKLQESSTKTFKSVIEGIPAFQL